MMTKRNVVATIAALAVMGAIAAAVLVAWPEQGEAAQLAQAVVH
jgi:type II secretory pathway pseudopilin PulG